jgi:preprotein translocase subunit YajC
MITKSKEFLNMAEGTFGSPNKAYGELKPGDTIVYNYGIEGKIVSVKSITDKTVEVVVSINGKEYLVKKNKKTMIGYKE